MGDDGDLLDRLRVLLLVRDHGVADLVVGHELFLKLGEDAALLLGAGDDQLEGGQQVLLLHGPAAQTNGPQGGFVDQIGQVRAHAPGGGQGDLFQVHILSQTDAAGVHLQGGQTARQVGPVDGDAAVEPTGTQQGLVQNLRAVGGSQEDDALGGVEAVHLRQELVQGLLALVVAAHAIVTGFADGVDLVDEDDAGGDFVGLLEEVPDTGRAHAHEHLHKVRAGDGEEGDPCLSRHGLGQQGLAGARRADEQSTLGELRADLGVFAGVVEEVDDLLQGFFRLILTGHIREGHAGGLFHIDLGVGLTHAAETAGAAHAAHDEDEGAGHNDHGQDVAQKHVHEQGGLFFHGKGIGDVVLLQNGQQVIVPIALALGGRSDVAGGPALFHLFGQDFCQVLVAALTAGLGDPGGQVFA